MKIKDILLLISMALILGLGWFLFLKKYDYQINFIIKTSPGTVFANILELEKWDISKQTKNIKIIDKTAFKNIKQQINLKAATYEFNWNIKPLNDTITSVSVGIIDSNNSKKQRLLLLFGKSDFVKKFILKVKDFKKRIEGHIKIFNVQIIGEDSTPDYESIIYVTFSSSLTGKVKEMMQNNFYLTRYMSEHKIKKAGNPFIKVTHWDIQKNTMTCQFSFPVENRESYPEDDRVKIMTHIPKQKALKAVFHGNYRYSDRAWFALYNYAKLHQIRVENKPLEIYLNNPHDGGTELNWQANVYLPITD